MALKLILGDWVFNVLIALDQQANALLGGWPDETLSARTWRNSQAGGRGWKVLRYLIDLIFWRDKNHCRESWLSEALGRQNAPDYRAGKPPDADN